MDERLRQSVRARAANRCEYCHFPDAEAWNTFQVDHILARSHGGQTSLDNLAWSCYGCNSYKGPNVAGWSSASKNAVRLFHPRQDNWGEHFRWNGCILVPKTEIATVTIDVLRINASLSVMAREAARMAGYEFD